MRLFSASEYEFGVIAVGANPVGIISLGMAPVGVVAIGILPIGIVSIACGLGLGFASFSCGIALGAFVRAVGLGVGADSRCTGLALGLGGDRPSAGGSPTRYWASVVASVAAVGFVLWTVGKERIAVTDMDRQVHLQWEARSHDAEGLYVADDKSCRVDASLRSDGGERLHADIVVVCGSLTLVERRLRHGCTVVQRESGSGHAYMLRCVADRVPATAGDDDSEATPEIPGLELDTTKSPAFATVHAEGPPPMHVSLGLDELSGHVLGRALLLDGHTELTGRTGTDPFANLMQ